MKTIKETLELALEALEKLNNTNSHWWQEVDENVIVQLSNAENALREALKDQPAQQTIHCKHRLESNGVCPHHNLHCGWPKCNESEQPAPVAKPHEQSAERVEPVTLKWQQAPVKTQWGDDMVVASVAIDKDHTVCLYCERDQAPKVEAMFAQQEPLTDEHIERIYHRYGGDMINCARAIERAAQRTWVHATTWRGLTDEQFQAIKDSLFRQQGWDGEGWDLALKEAIEAKLKEKNTL